MIARRSWELNGGAKRFVLLFFFVVVVIVVGCQKPPVDEPRVILRLNGSKVIGSELAPALAERFLQKKGGTGVTRDKGKAGEVLVKGYLPGLQAPQIIEVRATDSDAAFEALRQGFCDVGMSTRPITQKEREGIARVGFGDLTAPSTHRVIGADSVAIIVSSQNKVNSLTREQVGQIFSGVLTDWSQVSGTERGTIRAYVSEDHPHILLSLQEVGHEYGAAGQKASTVQLLKGSEVSETVSQDRLAVGAVSVPYLGAAKSVAIVGKDNVTYHPNLINLRAGRYPLSRPLYLYTAAASEGSLSGEFISFALSDEGQDVVHRAGFTKAADVAQAR